LEQELGLLAANFPEKMKKNSCFFQKLWYNTNALKKFQKVCCFIQKLWYNITV